jgi:predicted kinase
MALEALGDVPHTRESEVYLSKVRPAEYEALMAAARENLECGTSVIATAPFLRELGDQAWLQRLRASCTVIGATVHLAWIEIDGESMHTYVRRRGAARDAAKLSDWPTYLEAVNLDFRPAGPHSVIDNRMGARPLQDQAAELLTAITAPSDQTR